jgi:hypothetical protein
LTISNVRKTVEWVTKVKSCKEVVQKWRIVIYTVLNALFIDLEWWFATHHGVGDYLLQTRLDSFFCYRPDLVQEHFVLSKC